MNPVLRSRLHLLIGRRKNYLYERDDMGTSTRLAFLHRINEDIITLIDRSLILLGASPEPRRVRNYRVKPILQPDKPPQKPARSDPR